LISKLKVWFDSLNDNEGMDKENQILQVAFAVVLTHIIKADGIESKQEQERFSNFFKENFALETTKIEDLYNISINLEDDLSNHLNILREEMKKFPSIKIKLMHELNCLIQSDGIDNREYEEFEKIREILS